MILKAMIQNISDEIRALNQTVKNHIGSKLYKVTTGINIGLACFTAILLVITVVIQWQTTTLHKDTVDLGRRTIGLQEKTEELQKEILISQDFFREIETRPYLDIQVKDVEFGNKQNTIVFTVEFINKGKVPARNIILSGNLLGYEIMEERNWDIMRDSTIGIKLNIGPKEVDAEPLKEVGILLSVSYEGMKKDKQKYKTLVAGKIERKNGKGNFSPIAIKIDEMATAYENGFTALNRNEQDGGKRWPKLRKGLSKQSEENKK